MAYSTDGTSWAAGTSNVFGSSGSVSTGNILGIAYGNKRFVAVGEDGKIAYSNDQE
jgi:hypothetical protein